MKKYKSAGLFGLGRFGKYHAKCLKELCEEVYVTDVDESKRDEYEKNGFKWIKDIFPDYVRNFIVATPLETHKSVVNTLLYNGRNVLCEKPLAYTFEEVECLYSEKHQDNILGVGFTFLSNPILYKIKSFLMKDCIIGDLKHVTMNRKNFGPVREDASIFHDLMIHDISILSFLLDKPLYHEPYSQVFKNISGDIISSNASIVFHKNGKKISADISCSWDYHRKDREIVFNCDNGFLVWDDNNKSNPVSVYTKNGDSCEPLSVDVFGNEYGNLTNPLLIQDESFLSVCDGNKSNIPIFEADFNMYVALLLDKISQFASVF